MFENAINWVKEKAAQCKAVVTKAACTAGVAIATGAAVLSGGVAEAQTATPVTVDSMGIDITDTATNFGTQLGLIILAVLGITMGIAVIRFFAGWLGAKKAR